VRQFEESPYLCHYVIVMGNTFQTSECTLRVHSDHKLAQIGFITLHESIV